MKKVIDVITYILKCAHALGEGAKVAATNWPTDNPFTAADKGGSKDSE